MRVLAAMSGGVDSAVAAARAVEAGHDVVGVHLALARNPATLRTGARGCCTVEDAHDARRAADVLGVPFYVWDLAERFERDVVEDFVAEYAAGRTPNPCVRCNERIKFSALLDKALALGFDAVCTGHYARLEPGPELHRAVDAEKDQSYVLAVLTPERLEHALFPLGDTRKADVRREAAARGLQLAAKPDSHDICFVADGDTRTWLGERLGRRPGPILDADGEVVGEHDGAYAYTVGQRHGLRLGRPSPDGRPRYVLEVRPADDAVVVGPREAARGGSRRGRGCDLVRSGAAGRGRRRRPGPRARGGAPRGRRVRRARRPAPPRPAGAGGGTRPDGRPLRRDPRGRLGDDHRGSPGSSVRRYRSMISTACIPTDA